MAICRLYFFFLQIKGHELAAAALVAAAEHLVELQTDALNGGQQRLEADDHDVAQNDDHDVVGRAGQREDDHHHAGMHDDERAHTQEGDRVGKVAQHRFQQFKHALHQVVAHAARRLPRLALDHRGQQLGKQQQNQTGHHADDLAETVLINMCRGTSIKGLTGIKPINGDLLRPLLDCSRTDILQYIQDNQLGYRTDSTNNSLDFVRNKIRHRIIPVCKEINPAFLNVIRENCETLKETEQIYRYAIGQLKTQVMEYQGEEILIHIGKTLATPAPCTLLYELLTPFGFNKTQIRDIFHSRDALSGKQFLSENYTLVKGRTYWRMFCHTTQTVTNIEIEKPGEYTINGQHYRFEIIPRTPDFQIPDDSSIACLDADKLRFPLKIRNWEKGDRFCPLGMKKLQKKISDFFTDQKFSAKQKKDCLLLLSGEHIAWVIGYRPDERFKIISVTQNILKISVSDKPTV